MHKTNYQLIKEITKTIDNDSLKNSIIFYNTLIGTYNARKKYPENFIRQRQITGRITEAEEIAGQHKKTLELLAEKTPVEVNDILFKKIQKLDSKKIEEEGMYFYLNNAKKYDDLFNRIGKRLEIKLSSLKKTFSKNSFERDIKKGFCDEQFAMLEAILYEIPDYLK